MDSAATNYNNLANTDDGSCVYPCLDNEVVLNMYDSWGDGWNGASISVGDFAYTIDSGNYSSAPIVCSACSPPEDISSSNVTPTSIDISSDLLLFKISSIDL